MDSPTYQALCTDLKRDEGVRFRAYQDSVGVWTIGVGHNLQSNPLSARVVDSILDDDLTTVFQQLDHSLPWWTALDPIRQRVLANMGFNLGIGRLLQFTQTLRFIEAGAYDAAADAMLKSRWSQQVGQRAQRLAAMMRTGAEV